MASTKATREHRMRLSAIRRAGRIVLSERDSWRVLELLENPPKPTAALMTAAKRRAIRQ